MRGLIEARVWPAKMGVGPEGGGVGRVKGLMEAGGMWPVKIWLGLGEVEGRASGDGCGQLR